MVFFPGAFFAVCFLRSETVVICMVLLIFLDNSLEVKKHHENEVRFLFVFSKVVFVLFLPSTFTPRVLTLNMAVYAHARFLPVVGTLGNITVPSRILRK